MCTITDIDECNESDYPCDPNANFTNIIGSFSCTCVTGYSGDGLTCNGMNYTSSVYNFICQLSALHNWFV